MRVIDTGAPLSVPVGEATHHERWMVSSQKTIFHWVPIPLANHGC